MIMIENDTFLDDIPVVDSLTHVKEDGNWYNTHHDASVERLLTMFDRQYRKALLVGIPGDSSDYLLTVCQRYPDKFIPAAALEMGANDPVNRVEEKIINLGKKGFQGIKIHPRRLNMNLSHPNISRAIGLAGKHNLVSLLCTVHRPPLLPLKRPVYDILYQICQNNQNNKSKILLLHGGYFEILATSEMVRDFENVLLDLSVTIIRFQDTHLMEDIRFLFKTFDRRLCIGSDFPEYTMKDVLRVIREKELHRNLGREKLENIFSGNLLKFFNEKNES